MCIFEGTRLKAQGAGRNDLKAEAGQGVFILLSLRSLSSLGSSERAR